MPSASSSSSSSEPTSAASIRPGEYDRYRRRKVEGGDRADGQFKVLLTSDTSFAGEFAADRDLVGSQRTKA